MAKTQSPWHYSPIELWYEAKGVLEENITEEERKDMKDIQTLLLRTVLLDCRVEVRRT